MTITTEKEYTAALNRVDDLYDFPLGTPECNEMIALVDEIMEYEKTHYNLDNINGDD